nr:LTA synthase family protein [Ectobacillus ponti]
MLSTFRKLRFLLLAALLLWVKTYIICKIFFRFKIENGTQELLLLFGPLSSILLFLGLALLWRSARAQWVIILSSILTLVLFANVIFYGFFDDFLTIPVLFQKSNMGDLMSSIRSLLHPYIVLLFLDIVLLLFVWRRRKGEDSLLLSGGEKACYFLAAALLFAVNLAIAESERPQLLTRSFDREMLVKNIGLFHYHAYDALLQSRSSAQRALADGSKLSEIQSYTASRRVQPDTNMFGAARGRNVILVSMESLQSFVLGKTVQEEPVTPFLNQWAKNSYYFSNMYQQTGQGKTSDAEFLIETSLYPLDRGSVFFTHAGNEYVAAPEILQRHGYYTAVLHANQKSFWNRDYMYPSLGFNRYFHDADYQITPETSAGWGLKDREFFQQSIRHLQSLPQPFYAKLITLSNHFPFELPKQDQLLPEYASTDRIFSRYMQTVRYMDEALRSFVEELKDAGLYENSVLVFYGDHYGISANHYQVVASYLQKPEIRPFDALQLQRVPFFVHIPGHKGKEVTAVAGQVDVKPTLLHVLGIVPKADLHFGRNLFAKEEKPLTVLRDGSFITSQYLYTAGTCYDKRTEQPVRHAACRPYLARAKKELAYSDRIVYGDLLRFLAGNEWKRKENQTQFHERRVK